MTTYGEAFQMGLGANVAVCVLNEIQCAGDALNASLSSIDPETLPEELVVTLNHVLSHMISLREIAGIADEYFDKAIGEFDEANPGKLIEVSKEISEHPVILGMQDALGMSPEERLRKIEANLSTIAEQDAAKNG